MEKYVSGALERLTAALHQFLAALAKDLNGDVRRNAPFVDQAATEIELDLGSGRESDFDLFKADLRQHLEKAKFFVPIHRLGQGLIAVSEVDTAPDGGPVDNPVGPLSIR